MTMTSVPAAAKMTGRRACIIRGWARDGKIRAEKRPVKGHQMWFVDPTTFPPRPPKKKLDGVCLRCDRAMKIANWARILCGTCVTQATRNGELDDYPILTSRKNPTRAEIMLEEFPHLRKFLGYHGAIDRLAVVYKIDPLSVQKVIGARYPATEFKEAA